MLNFSGTLLKCRHWSEFGGWIPELVTVCRSTYGLLLKVGDERVAHMVSADCFLLLCSGSEDGSESIFLWV